MVCKQNLYSVAVGNSGLGKQIVMEARIIYMICFVLEIQSILVFCIIYDLFKSCEWVCPDINPWVGAFDAVSGERTVVVDKVDSRYTQSERWKSSVR